jgi:predicted esterase
MKQRARDSISAGRISSRHGSGGRTAAFSPIFHRVPAGHAVSVYLRAAHYVSGTGRRGGWEGGVTHCRWDSIRSFTPALKFATPFFVSTEA